MTTALATPTTSALKLTYLLDAAVTAGVGLLALEAPVAWFDVPGWVVRTVGALLLVTAVDLVLVSRASGRALKTGTTVVTELCFAWAAGTVAVLALRDVPAEGVEVLTLVGLVTLAFGIAYARLGRALR